MAGRKNGRAKNVAIHSKNGKKRVSAHVVKQKPKKRAAKAHIRHNTHNTAPIIKQLPGSAGMHDIEEILASSITEDNSTVAGNALLIPEILYNATPTLRSIAYKSGFSTGSIIYQKSGKNADTLLDVLEKAGLGKVLYYPFEDRVIITTQPRKAQNLGKMIHTYESGMIAGYLSSALGTPVNVEETHCVYNGNSFCQFVARPLSGSMEPRAAAKEDTDAVIPEIASSIYNSEDGNTKGSEAYYVLSMLPLASGAAKEVSKIFYIAGREIAEMAVSSGVPIESILQRIASSIGVSMQVVRKYRKMPSLINVRYSPVSSMEPMVSISSSLLAGFSKGAFGADTKFKRRLSGSNEYIVSMLLGKGKSNK